MPDTESECRFQEESLTGWGRFEHFKCRVLRTQKISDVETALQNLNGSTLIARGFGRSYGDSAVNENGFTLLTEKLNKILSFDEESGLLCAESGISLETLLKTFVPRGWMLPVVPGTKHISLGGAVAADIHGKNHHRDGSFSKHVRSFKLIDSTMEVHECSREKNPDIFWATIGGMGLTGVISEVQLHLQKIPSALIAMKIVPAANLEELVNSFEEYEPKHHFCVAWLDCLSEGNQRGRGILLLGDFEERHSLAWKQPAPIPVPVQAPNFLLNSFSMGLFNELYYRLPRPTTKLLHANEFFFPLDRIRNWNKLYGPRGFIQYQCLLPGVDAKRGLEQILQLCQSEGLPSYFGVLKRFAKAEPREHASLSFPDEGFTLAIDLPGSPRLATLCRKLDKVVIEHGGRIYLAKDSMMNADTFSKMYPQAQAWQSACAKVNATGAFSSHQAKRLGLR